MHIHQNSFLEQLGASLDWKTLESFLKAQIDTANWRCHPLTLLKVVILQYCYKLSDAKCLELLADRTSWRVFAGLPSDAETPDAGALQRFRASLTEKDFHIQLLGLCNQQLRECGLTLRQGTMGLDASLEPEKLSPPDSASIDTTSSGASAEVFRPINGQTAENAVNLYFFSPYSYERNLG